MSRIALEDIGRLVREVLDRSPLAAAVRDVAVELPSDFDDGATLLVVVTLDHPDRVNIGQASAILNNLQDAVLRADDRFPVIQFADAA